MNNINNQSQSNDARIIDYCKTVYQKDGQQVVNNYRCNQQSFSTSNFWHIRRSKREFVINTGFSGN
ncbi:MAG TPA: hypothetical protein VGQ53_06070 [Chitinophagaceae bacterium]|jgi:hypothetical protein|nr:hypothetical protein [Chitinophagaceae bacterium]